MLRYHLEVQWPDALIDDFDPQLRGSLPPSFVERGYDVVLLGDPLLDEGRLETLRRLKTLRDCPPIIVFARDGDEFLAVEALRAGASYYFPKDRVRYQHLVEVIRGCVPADEVEEDLGDPFAGDERRRVRGYRAVQRLHVGDLAVVYLAENDSGERAVVKILRQVPDRGQGEKAFSRFLQEFELIAQLDHPGIVSIRDLGIADDHAFIIMEYLSAGSLAERLMTPMDPETALGCTAQIAQALEAIHEAGILHRDLKPANVMFRRDGSLALIDFGLAKRIRLEAAITGSGQIFGTPYYMSPEQGHGVAVDERSDLYSLGVILYEMLTSRRPYVASSPFGVIYQHRRAPRPTLPEELAAYQPLIAGTMAADPADRFDSAASLLAALERA